jgi:cAMP-binding proteins - catabolite gene activator and regulatory subunit of cAMP-dependent protein kinases
MTRDEIGSYLGLSLETVSRLLSRFAEEGILAVRQKHVVIRDVAALSALVSGRHSGEPASMACSLRTMA